MSDVFVQKAKEQFIEYSTMWIDFIHEKFPECEETKDCKIFLDSIVKHSPSKTSEQIGLWVDKMSTPLNVKRTKYAKAVERITKQPAVLYHALSYKDFTALRENSESEIALRVRLFDKYNDERLTDADRTTVWKFLDKITCAAFEASEKRLPDVPTRVEIQENIKSRKEKNSEDAPSMTKAFQTHINAMCKQLKEPPMLENVDDATVKTWMSRWNSFAKASTYDEKNVTMCSRKDPRIIHVLAAAFPEFKKITTETVNDNVWKNINQLNGFSAVSENIPTKMMGRIEDMASRLADDIVAGRTDMASVNLSDIGQQVLAGCDEADMSKFANNIEELLPALQNFQQRM